MSESARRKAIRWIAPRWLGLTLLVLAALLAYWLNLRVESPRPPSAGDYAIWTIVTLGATILGTSKLANVGRVDPQQARSVARHIWRAGTRTAVLRIRLEDALASGDKDELYRAALIAAGEIAGLEDLLNNSFHDWEDIHPDAVQAAMEELR